LISPTSPQQFAVDPETGIVRWIVEISDDPGEPAIFNYSTKMADTSVYLPLGCYDINGGAGMTREAAYGAALGEALERYCCSVYFKDELVLGSHREVAKHGRALGPNELRLFHPRQREQIRYDWFDEDAVICWTEAFSLTRDEPVLVPACLTYIPYYPFHRDRGECSIGPSISTGQACASTDSRAVLRGLCEVVERDAFTITWLQRLTPCAIDLHSSPELERTFRERFARPHLEYSLLQLPSDIEISCVLCVLVDRSVRPPRVSTGGAASLEPREAVLKALVEAVQTRQWAKFLGQQPHPLVVEPDYSNNDDFEKHVFLYAYADMLESVGFLREPTDSVELGDLPRVDVEDAGECLAEARARVEAVGAEVMVVDLTTDDVRDCGYRVVKVLVPSAQQLEGDHNHRLLGSPRLFDVPRRIGQGDRTYAMLNPAPHPYP
jgi:ribosomal protein S12 methylthiotransferase accessory factor